MLTTIANAKTGNRQAEVNLPLEVVLRHPASSRTARHKSIWRKTFGILLLLGSVGGGLAAVHPFVGEIASVSQSPTDGQPTESVSPSMSVVALGRLEPEGEIISVAAPSGSGETRIQQLLVREGDIVGKNQVLAVLDNQDRLAAARQVALDTVEQSQASLARTILEVETTRSQMRAALRAAEARLTVAKVRLERAERLNRAHAISQEEFDDRALSVTTEEEAVREAASRMKRYEAGAQSESVDIALARKDLVVAESSLKQAESNLEQAVIRAPIRGTILQLNRRVGERVGQSALLEMGATGNMMACVEVYESEISRIRLGQLATLTAGPFENSLSGEVDRISNLVQRQEIVDADPAANTDARVLEVWVRLDAESSTKAANFVNLQVRVEFQP